MCDISCADNAVVFDLCPGYDLTTLHELKSPCCNLSHIYLPPSMQLIWASVAFIIIITTTN